MCVCVYVSCVAAACYDMLKEALEKRPHYTEGGWGGDEHGRVMESGMKMEGGRRVVGDLGSVVCTARRIVLLEVDCARETRHCAIY